MSIWTLLKAHIKHKKGVFVGIIILSFLISLILSISISSINNINLRAEESMENANFGKLIFYYLDELLPQELVEEVEQMPEVESTFTINAVSLIDRNQSTINGKTTGYIDMFQPYATDKIRLPIFDRNKTDLLEIKVEPKPGEVYVPYSYIQSSNCDIGDQVAINTKSVQKTYVISGFLEDVTQANMISFGTKNIYMNKADYLDIEAKLKQYPEEFFQTSILHIYQSEKGINLSEKEFSSLVEEKTGIRSLADIQLSDTEVKNYSVQITTSFVGLMIVFCVMLFLMTILIINFNITSFLEEDYVNIGALKAVGFKTGQLSQVYIWQFISAMLLGLISGFITSIFLMKYIRLIFLGTSSLLISDRLVYGSSLGVLLFIIIITLLFIMLKMSQIDKISPMRALSGGRSGIYFKSGGSLSLGKPLFSLRFALRQLFASFKQYISALLIIACLVFFVLTISSTLTALEPESIMADYYGFDFDLTIAYFDSLDDIPEIEKEISRKTKIKDSYSMSFRMVSFEKNPVGLYAIESGDYFSAMLAGRPPKYENEIASTKILAEAYNLEIGDSVTIKDGQKSEQYILTGFYQSINNGGYNFAVITEGYTRLNPEFKEFMRTYLIEDRDKASEIHKNLSDKYSDKITVENAQDIREQMKTIVDMSASLTVIVMGIAAVYIFISSFMVASKIFLKEKIEYGIYKSIGMRTRKMRAIFTLRFLIVSSIGSTIGTLAYKLFGNALLGKGMRMLGISNFNADLNLVSILIPCITLTLIATFFSWLISAKIKKVGVSELIAT